MVDEVVVLLCLGQGLGDFLLQILEDELRAAAHLTGKNQIFAALQMNSLVLADYLFWLFYVTRYFNQLYFKNFLLIKMCHNSLKWQNNVNKKNVCFSSNILLPGDKIYEKSTYPQPGNFFPEVLALFGNLTLIEFSCSMVT